MGSTSRDQNNNNNYAFNNYYTKYTAGNSNSFIFDSGTFNGGGYLLVSPWNNRNLWITGGAHSLMVFTLNSTVNIQNSVFFDIGDTKGDVLDDNTLDSTYTVTHSGTNLPDRYPISLLHNKKAVTINNNFFQHGFALGSSVASIPRSFNGAKHISSSANALSIFGNSWTKCGWVSEICKTTGKLSKVSPTPSTVTESVTGAVRSITNEVSMLTSYLANDVTLGIKSSVNITLPSSSSFKFFIYSYNADYTGANIYGPFFYNTDSTYTKLIIEWASDNIKYSIPICGIEIFSNISSPLVIPTPTPSSGGAV
ncbi:hypothetical protein ACTFIW_009657 [Dictyostelium discoideum]